MIELQFLAPTCQQWSQRWCQPGRLLQLPAPKLVITSTVSLRCKLIMPMTVRYGAALPGCQTNVWCSAVHCNGT